MKLKVFVDFDGTIAKDDVGNDLFRRFGGEECETLVQRYRRGDLSAVECFRSEAAAAGSVLREELFAFLRTCEMDPSFAGFVRFCLEHQITPTVLSDGLDLYINEILAAHG